MANDCNSSIAWKYDEDKDLDTFRTSNPANTWQQLALLLNRRHHGDAPVRTAQEVRERYAQITGEHGTDDQPQTSSTNPQIATTEAGPTARQPVLPQQRTRTQLAFSAHYNAWESGSRTIPGVTTYNEYVQQFLSRPPVSSWYRIVPGPLETRQVEVGEEEGQQEDHGYGISRDEGDGNGEKKQS